MNDLDMASSGDDTIFYSVDRTKELVLSELKELSAILFKLFDNQY